MVTKKNIIIPIYGYALTIIIFDNWEDLRNHVPDHVFESSSLGVVLNDFGRGLVAIQYGAESTIAHESLHIVENIWRYIGYDSIEGNNEVGAYLLTYIFEQIKKVYDKHSLSNKL